MKITIVLLKLIFLSFTFHNVANATMEEVDCSNEQGYRYGKLFHEGRQYDRESVYLSREHFKQDKKTNNYNASINDKALMEKGDNPNFNISGKVSGNHVIISISLTNMSKREMIIPKKNISHEGWLAGSIFSITSGCVSLDYLGPIVNFGGTYTYPDDYIIIAPRETFNDRVFIDEYYHFIPGAHDYEIELLAIPFAFKPELIKGEIDSHAKSNIIKLKVNSAYLNNKIRGNYCSGDKCELKKVRWMN